MNDIWDKEEMDWRTVRVCGVDDISRRSRYRQADAQPADGQLRPHTLPTLAPAPSSHLRLSLILISRSPSPSPWPLSSTSTPQSSTRPARTALASASSASRTLPPSPARTSGRATRRADSRWPRASSTTRAGVSGALAVCQRATQSTPSSYGCSRAASRYAR